MHDTGLLHSASLRANLGAVQQTVEDYGVQRSYADMWIFTKPIQQLQAEDVESLITNRVREHVALEFKREMYGRSEADIREMLRDVSSIANAEGGALIIGMEEDGEGVATALRPVPDAEAQAQRLIGSCTASIAERIPGLQAAPVPIPRGHVIVVRIPRSYRRPHMVTFGGPTDFWVRHDRQKSRMSIAEIRTAITTTEDLVVKLERFIEGRRSHLAPLRLLAVMATPLLLEEGRIDVLDDQVTRLLRQPPSYRTAAQGGITLTDEARPRTIPTLRGVMVQDERSGRTVELYRNAHLEFRLADFNGIVEARQSGQSPLIYGWAVAELVRNFMHLLDALRDLTAITDPYTVTLSAFRLAGYAMYGSGGQRPLTLAPVAQSIWNEGDHLFLPPIQVPLGGIPDSSAQLLMDRLWNAFHFEKCPFFDQQGRFALPNR
jgi:hypothetical protein